MNPILNSAEIYTQVIQFYSDHTEIIVKTVLNVTQYDSINLQTARV